MSKGNDACDFCNFYADQDAQQSWNDKVEKLAYRLQKKSGLPWQQYPVTRFTARAEKILNRISNVELRTTGEEIIKHVDTSSTGFKLKVKYL